MGPRVPKQEDAGTNLRDESSKKSLPARAWWANALSQIVGNNRASLSMAAAYGALFVTGGVYLPFFPVFLGARGLSPEVIGVVIAVPMAVRLVAMPVAGILSDRFGHPRAFLIGLGLGAAAGFALIGFATGAVAIMAA